MNKKIFFVILLIIITISMTILIRSHNRPLILQGEVDAPNIIIASKAKGRVLNINFNPGDSISKGDLLLNLDSPELEAQVEAASAVRDQAKSQLDLSMSGSREESIRYYKALLDQAKINYNNSIKDYERNKTIKGYISQSTLDNAEKLKDVAYQQVLSAQANLDQAIKGDRIEQHNIYVAQLKQAEENLKQLMIQYQDVNVTSPVNGEIGSIPANVGEYFNANSPLMTVVQQEQAYFVFNIRENLLANIHKNDCISLTVPALGNQPINAEVRYISQMGDYSTKRATRATGDFDLKTFEIRLYPLEPVKDLRAGMSVLWKLKA